MGNPEQLVFGLDIGTRSIVGTVGYKQSMNDFTVVAQAIKMHDTRAMMDGQTVYDAERNDGMELALGDLEAFYSEIKGVSAEALQARFATLSYRRAQTVAYGLAALIAIMRYLGVDKCVTSEADNMEGYLKLKGRA